MINIFLRASLVIYAVCSLISMAPMNLSFSLMLIMSLIAFLNSDKNSFKLDSSTEYKNYRFWALALLITCWGSLIIAKFWPYAYAGHDPEITSHGFLKIWYLLIPAVLLYAFKAASDGKTFSLVTIIKPWWLATFALMIVAIIQFFTGWPLSQLIPGKTDLYHSTLFYGHHLSTASIIIFPTFTALAVAFGFYSRKKESDHLIHHHLALIVGLAGALTLFLSYARTAWLALLIGFGLLIKKYVLHNFSRKQWLSGGLGILIGLGIFSQTDLVRDRIQKFYGINERFRLWTANYDFFTHRPLTGIGWLKTQEMSEFYFKHIDPVYYKSYFWGHAHSNFFEMLGGTGLFGLLAFLGWSLFTLRLAHQLATRFELAKDYFYSDFSRGIFIALILLHFNGITNVTFWEGKVMHQQMLVVGMLLILNQRLKTTS